jgi:hypothetical protein
VTGGHWEITVILEGIAEHEAAAACEYLMDWANDCFANCGPAVSARYVEDEEAEA